MKHATKLTHAGRDPKSNHGVVNPPVYHASTILFDTVEQFHDRGGDPQQNVIYGRRGTPGTFAFQEAMAIHEGAGRCLTYPSGLAAITGTLMAFLNSGDHLLLMDNGYGPGRRFADGILTRLGVETTYYDPLIGADIASLMRPNTRVVMLEAPGSLTFEVMDVPAIARAAHDAGAIAILDNTWSGGLFFRPFDHGVDVSVQAATKYIVGHSDAMLGTATFNEEHFKPMLAAWDQIGFCAAPDDIYLAQRGLRTLKVRLDQHMAGGLAVANWLAARPEAERVLHPALPGDPGHEIWKRDFLGASGLFGIILNPVSREAIAAMLNGMKLFGMGYSWGGYESLLIPSHPEKLRSTVPWAAAGRTMRIHIGLEDPEDLIADLEAGFERMSTAD